jgi:hypothetical protein
MDDLVTSQPWIEGTIGEQGAELALDTIEDGQVSVIVEGEGRPVGTLVQVRWFGIGDGTSPVPPFETPWQQVRRASETMRFSIPLVEANLRPGIVWVSFTVLSADATAQQSPARQLLVNHVSSLFPPEVEDANNDIIPFEPTRSKLVILAPRQPWLVPPGSQVTFYWETVEPAPDRCRGWDDCAAPTDGPACAAIPLQALARFRGRRLSLRYTTDTYSADGLHLARYDSPLRMFSVDGGSELLPHPEVPGAVSQQINLEEFDQGLPVRVLAWPSIAEGQRFWMWIEGTDPEGPRTIVALDGVDVTGNMLLDGVSTQIPLSSLEGWQDGCVLTVRCELTLVAGDDRRSAFPKAAYTLMREPAARGRALESENMDGAVTLAAGTSSRLRFLVLTALTGQLSVVNGASGVPFLHGRYISLSARDTTARLILDFPVRIATLGLRVSDENYPPTVTVYDRYGGVLETRHVTTGGIVTLQDPEGRRKIASIDIACGPAQGAAFDELLCETGNEWRELNERIVETFDDVPLGEHGELLITERWSISTDGGRVGIAAEPGGNGACLTVRTTPEGRIHYLTPHFASRPKLRIELRIRTAGSAPHTVTVEVTYVNVADRTIRSFSKQATVGPTAYAFAFTTVQLPSDMEYVSHLRIIHATGNAITAVLYDDITIE